MQRLVAPGYTVLQELIGKALTEEQRLGNTKPLFRPAAATARLHRRPRPAAAAHR
jgi:hypothetical protein